MTSITIPNSVTYIGNGAFSGCSGLTSITIPNSVTEIGDYTFEYCSSLTNITIPNAATNIGDFAFYGCSSLTSITIPKSVTYIGKDAFNGCELRTILAESTSPEDNKYYDAFSPATYTHATLYVPTGTFWDYVYKTQWGEFVYIKEMARKSADVKADVAYMLADEKGCNYTVYDARKKELANVEYTFALDEEDPGTCWIVKNGTQLYNLGAQRYAAMDANGNISLSTTPVDLDIEVNEQGLSINGHPRLLVLNQEIDATAIRNIESGTSASHSIYDLSGHRLTAPQRGINIVGGKKVLVK